ncbi:MAG TPA: MFS transporter [Actinophytocola sp.]|jgi:MFS family permease|nr:MFS transporter [Actinophytocola sp.]
MTSAPVRSTAPGTRLPALLVTLAFGSMLFSANLAAPLYAGYAERFGFSTAVLALIFAVYALVLIPSLLVFGQVSDSFGRRPVIAAGLVTAIVALLLFAFAASAWWLFAARAVQGLAQGMMSGAATAALAELVPGQDARRAALMATLAQSGGSASGVLVSGILAQWAAAPQVLPYVAGMTCCLLAIVALRTVPETARRATRSRLRVRRPRVPAEIRGAFFRVGLTAAAVWAVAAGLFLSIIPSYAGKLVLHSHNLALLGAVSALVLGCSCLAQLAVRRGAPPATAQAGGLTLLAAGLLCLVLSAPLQAPVLLVAGAVLAGVGHGLAFLAAQDDLTHIAPADQRAEVSAAFYVCVYLGVALPIIGIGVVAVYTTLFIGVTTFAAVTGTAAMLLAGWHLRHRAPAQAPVA